MLGCKLRSGTLKTKESWGGLVRVPLGHSVDLIYGEEGATPNFVGRIFFSPKSWPNRLATLFGQPCIHLHFKLVMTCAQFGRDQICTQVNASFSPSGHPMQVK